MNKHLICFYFLFQLIYNSASSQPIGFSYYKIIDIDSSIIQGNTDFIDFQMLFTTNDVDLKSVANGGHVDLDSGIDIIFTESDGITIIDHEIEYYNPIAGNLVAWLKIPTLYSSTNTTIFLYYGNPCAVSDSSNIWSNEFEIVLHLNQDPSNSPPQIIDSSPNGNLGTTLGAMTTGNSVVGLIANGISFDEINDAIVIPDFDYTLLNAFSVSFWFNVNDNTGNSYQYLFSHGNYGVFNSLNIYFGENSLGIPADQNMLKTIFQDSNDVTNTNGLDAGNTFTDGNWHYYVFTVNTLGNPTIYIDGTPISNIVFQGGNTFNPTTDIFLGSRSDLNTTRFYGGVLDEFRIINTNKTVDQILTEYYNQLSPNSFYTISNENNTGDFCIPLPVELLWFNAFVLNKSTVKLEWTTMTETNNNYFEIQRSSDGINWIKLYQISGSGNSNTNINYEYIDKSPLPGISYYRLKQIDFNGQSSLSPIRTVNFIGIEIINSYPNPSSEILFLTINSTQNSSIKIDVYSTIGKLVYTDNIVINKGFLEYKLYTSIFNKGSYLLRISTLDGLYYDQIQFQTE